MKIVRFLIRAVVHGVPTLLILALMHLVHITSPQHSSLEGFVLAIMSLLLLVLQVFIKQITDVCFEEQDNERRKHFTTRGK